MGTNPPEPARNFGVVHKHITEKGSSCPYVYHIQDLHILMHWSYDHAKSLACAIY